MATEGLITIKSNFGPEDTMKRLEAEVKARGLTVFAHVDHAAGAAAVDLKLRPTDLLIFGNAKGGTPLMQQAQTVGIDLPLKALIWQDEQGATWLSYNDPAWLAQRHGAGEPARPIIAALTGALHAIATKATAPWQEEVSMTSTDNRPAVASSAPEGGKLARWVVIAVLCTLLLAACILGYLGWTSTDTKVPEAGYVALVLGVVFSLVVGAGLMALVFYSSRKGYDEPVILTPEPESEQDDGRDAQR